MALANVAWVLASNGFRVLAVDWDLEAPGLHRYFHPFLDDKELTTSKGIIDLVVDFAAAAFERSEVEAKRDTEWYLPYANILRYATSLDWAFPSPGSIDLVPAGRQDSSYPIRVNSFHWQNFYERLGGGLFLEAVKNRMRAEYDFVLIDSRTGVSDTSGVCTVQMPDALVVCFTMNAQNLEGAAAVAQSAQQSRLLPDGSNGLQVWPVPMRVELFEKEKLEIARDLARHRFQQFLSEEGASGADQYWGAVEVPYQPYYAFEEVLAAFADRPGQPNSMLAAVERLTAYLTAGTVTSHPGLTEPVRQDILRRYTRKRWQTTTPSQRPFFYISCAPEDLGGSLQKFYTDLDEEVKSIHGPGGEGVLGGGDSAADHNAAAQSEVILCMMSPAFVQNKLCLDRFLHFQRQRKPVLPVLWDDFQPGGSAAAQDLMFRLRAFASADSIPLRLRLADADGAAYRRDLRVLARRMVRSAKNSRAVSPRPVQPLIFGVLTCPELERVERWQPYSDDGITLGDIVGDTSSDLYLFPQIVDARSLTDTVHAMGKPTATVLIADMNCLAQPKDANLLEVLRQSGLLQAVVYCSRTTKGAAAGLSGPDAPAPDLESLTGLFSFYAYDAAVLEQSLRRAAEHALHRIWQP
jgi:hypothetical protein